MIILNPLARRITYVLVFELFAIVLATLLLDMISEGKSHSNLPVAATASLVAVVWNFIYNTAFEAWERRTNRSDRTMSLRIFHAFGFEAGLILFLIPLFMWWYSVGPLTAFIMEAALLIFFLVYTFLFTLLFDRVVKSTTTLPATRV